MGGYIGSRSVVLSTTAANVQDVTATDTTPEVTIVNTTHEDTDGGREGKVIFKGQQSGGEETTLAEIQSSHDGTADDEKGDLIFKTNDGSDGASPTEAMRIDSSQNVGIGTSSPSTYNGQLVNYLDTGSGTFLGHANGSGTFPKVSAIGMGSDAVSFTHTSGGSTYALAGSAQIAAIQSAASGAPTDLAFYTNASGSVTERVRIGSDGSFKVLTMPVGGTANLHYSSGGGGQFFVTSSSKRFKHDIVDYDKGLAEVLQMQPKYFVYNDEPSRKQRAGFIAEDFHDIGMTEYVEYWKDEDGEDTPSEIGYSNMVAVLVKSIQELSAKNDALEAQNTTQATQIADLITRVTALEAG